MAGTFELKYLNECEKDFEPQYFNTFEGRHRNWPLILTLQLLWEASCWPLGIWQRYRVWHRTKAPRCLCLSTTDVWLTMGRKCRRWQKKKKIQGTDTRIDTSSLLTKVATFRVSLDQRLQHFEFYFWLLLLQSPKGSDTLCSSLTGKSSDLIRS